MKRRGTMMRTAVILAVSLAACGGRRPAEPPAPAGPAEPFEGSFTPPPSPGAEVVAEVNGRAIYLEDVERQARARHLDPRRALDELVEMELLAQEAERRGYANTPEATRERKRTRVRRLIERVFAGEVFDGPEDVPQAEVDRTLVRPDIRAWFDHPESHVVSYARVQIDRTKASPAELEAARQVAEEIRTRAVAAKVASVPQFHEIAEEVAVARGAKLDFLDTYAATEGATDPEFLALAFTIHEIGDVSKPGITNWGWDVLYLHEIIPARHATDAEKQKETREKLFEDSRGRGFQAWADGLAAGLRVTLRPELLERIDVISPAGLPDVR